MRTRRFKRLFGTIVLVSSLLIAAFGTILYLQFKDTGINPREIAFRDPVPVAAPQPQADQESVSGATSPANANPPAQTPNPLTSGPLLDYLIERYNERGGGYGVDVCANLSQIPTAPPKNLQEFVGTLNRRASGETREDPFAEAALAPLGEMFRLASVAEVADRMRTARDTGDLSLLQSADMNAVIARASSELFSARPFVDRKSQHAYHLWILTKVVALDEGLSDDPRIQSICTEIERRANQPANAQANVDLNAEKAAMLRLMADVGIAPQQVGFDANMGSEVRMNVGPNLIAFSAPWMVREFGGTIRLELKPAQTQGQPGGGP